MGKLVEKKVEIVGVTSNQATAINLALIEIEKLKARDEAPLAKFKRDLDGVKQDQEFFTEIHSHLKPEAKKLIRRVEERIETLQTYEKQLNGHIAKYQDNVDYITGYINRVKSHIREEVLEEKVMYQYDAEYFETWLDFASIMFEFEVSDDEVAKE